MNMSTAIDIIADDFGFIDLHIASQHMQLDSEEWQQIFSEIISRGCRGVILHLEAVKTPTSPFMSSLVWCRQMAHENGFDCCLVNCSERLTKALTITNLHSVLMTATNRLEAVRALSHFENVVQLPKFRS